MLTGQNGILNRAGEAKEKTDVAQKDEPAVLKAHHMQNGVDDEDPDQQHQAEAEQETLGDGFVHENIPLS